MTEREEKTESARRPRVSAIVPCFNEQESLPELHRRLGAACAEAAGDD